jgi:hypothetical protein
MWCESTPRTASVNPQPMASSGTWNGSQVFVRPAHVGQRLLDEVERARGRVGLEVRAGPVTFDRVRPLRHLPLQRDLGLQRRLRQVDEHAVTGRLEVVRVHEPGERGRPESGDRPAAGVEGEVVLAVEPAW